MIVTFRVNSHSDMAVASLEALKMGIEFTPYSDNTFDVSIKDDWKLDYFHSKVGHSEIIARQIGG